MEEKHNNKALFTKMLVLYLLLVIVVGGAMLASTIKTQVVDGDMWRAKAKDREEIERIEPARRGNIFSSDDKVLATTVPVCDLCLDLGRWPRMTAKDGEKNPLQYKTYLKREAAFEANLGKVCKILHTQFPGKSEQYFRSRIINEWNKKERGHCLYVARRVPYSQWETIRKLPGWGGYVATKTAEGSVTSYVRAHIYGNLGENTIGLHYKTPQKEGYTGLEGYYDSVLRGKDGKYICRRLTRGIWLPMEDGDVPDEDSTLVQHREDGKSIVATIDTRYQDIAESALRNSMNQYGGQAGCAILMEVETGYVLACSSLTRDTNGQLKENLWSNVACSDSYEPGSTFKTVVMTSMLSDKQIALDTSKRVRAGGVKRFSATSGEINDGHGFATDTASLPGVLAKSSNVGMCELAWEYYRNRREDLKKGIESIFPFGRMHPDIEVLEPNTRTGKLNSDRDFLNLSYGYSATVTPLQLITFYNALANGGRMVKPLFCREIIEGRRSRLVKPVVLNEHVCSEEVAAQMRSMLVGVVEHGTGNNIRNTVYGIAGKTGTTQGITDKSIKNSSFVGFFPADNPRYTCLVLVERTSIAGRYAAAPVFRKIADCVVAFDKELGSIRLSDSIRVERPVATKSPRTQLETIHRLLGMPFAMADSTQATPWAVYDATVGGYMNYQVPSGVVPDCHGMTVRDAMRLLHKVGLKTRFSGQGKVVSQSPKPRTPVRRGATVTLELKP
jgi:cell division protein FtsI (penicillin-binding protein 3)